MVKVGKIALDCRKAVGVLLPYKQHPGTRVRELMPQILALVSGIDRD
jgi:hypothetical protein